MRQYWVAEIAAAAVWLLAADAVQARDVTPDIVSGQTTAQWPGVGVVLISLSGGGAYECTGTAITPRWVLTAAHCVDPASVGSGAAFSFLIGQSDAAPDATFASDQQTYHPSYNPANESNGHDIGLIHVTTDMPVFAFKLNSTFLTSGIDGSTALTIGYGTTSGAASDSGIKRIAAIVIASHDTRFLYSNYTPSGTCSGDSGGPLYVYDADGFPLIIGATSFGDASCNSFSAYQRVDVDLSFVTAAVTSGLCLDGQSCDGVFRNGLEPPL